MCINILHRHKVFKLIAVVMSHGQLGTLDIALQILLM